MRVVGDAGTNTLLVTATPADFEHRKRVIDELERVAANPEADPDEDGGEQPAER